MDAHDELAVNRGAPPASSIASIERVWKLLESEGLGPAIEELMRLSHEDVELHSYVARGAALPGDEAEVLRGVEQVRAYYRNAQQQGVSVKARARSFEADGDSVVVRGSVRVVRPDGSFAETKLLFSYHFRDGLIDEIGWQPRAGE
jgi:ketosteroid isomerase-like protein